MQSVREHARAVVARSSSHLHPAFRFDGRGRFSSSEVGRFGGERITRTFAGPYTVNSDCSGFLDFSSNITVPPHEAHGAFVIVDQGQGFFILDDEDEWAAGGVGRKL